MPTTKISYAQYLTAKMFAKGTQRRQKHLHERRFIEKFTKHIIDA